MIGTGLFSMDFSLLLTCYLMGLLGSLHCIGMCGGIAGALSMAVQGSPNKKWMLIGGYHLGRVSSYTTLGLLFAALWQPAYESAALVGVISRSIAGALIIGVGLYIGKWWFGITHLERVGAKFWRRLQGITHRLLPVNNIPKSLALGLLWGWLPCGLVYSALSLAIASGNATQGAFCMLCFGLGTLPVVIGTSVVFKELQTVLQTDLIRMSAAVIFLIIGTWTLVSAWRAYL